MPKIPSLHAVLQGWLLDGPLAAYVPAYVERLERGRYASSTSRRWLNAVAHFAHWMSLCRLPVDRLDEAMAQVTQLGGDIYHGPRQMPNGAWVAQCEDPQGAVLGLLQAP